MESEKFDTVRQIQGQRSKVKQFLGQSTIQVQLKVQILLEMKTMNFKDKMWSLEGQRSTEESRTKKTKEKKKEDSEIDFPAVHKSVIKLGRETLKVPVKVETIVRFS